MKRVAFVLGTRPEAIKLAPVVLELRRRAGCQALLCVTAQHREMLDQVLELFDLTPDCDLDLMKPDQTLGAFTARAIASVSEWLEQSRPDLVVVQGDTSTVFCSALAAFYLHIPVAHVEAGLRTGDKFAPYPEEINRLLCSRLADLHFAPTAWAADNLLREGIPAERVHVTGNTGIDALLQVREELRQGKLPAPVWPDSIPAQSGKAMVLITGHRRENFGEGFLSICAAVRELAEQRPSVQFVYPVHLNPRVQEPVNRILGDLPNVVLIPPQSYSAFVDLMDRATLILTDSGGVQEEAPSLGKPVLVMREKTERPEGIEAGVVRLVGTDQSRIVAQVSELLDCPTVYRAMAHLANPYGDGHASERIVSHMFDFVSEF